jgi:hypothetical protein
MGEMVAVRISTALMRSHELPDGLKVTWIESDTEQVSHAERTFYSYIKEGWIAFKVDENEKKQILIFDPKLNRIVLIPPLGGG